MNREETTNLITEQMANQNLAVGELSVSSHTHNGVDSPQIQSRDINALTGFYFPSYSGNFFIGTGNINNTPDILTISAISDGVGTLDIGVDYPFFDINLIATDAIENEIIGTSFTTTSVLNVTGIRYTTTDTTDFALGLPNLSSLPATCATGELAVQGGQLYLCSPTNTWNLITTTVTNGIVSINSDTTAAQTLTSNDNSITIVDDTLGNHDFSVNFPAGGVTSVSGTANRITSTGGTTPVIDISASYVGQSSITTLGTITTGVWNGTAIANANLANSSITIGSTNIALGATSTTLVGLSSVTSTTFVGALTGNASTATALQTGRTISITGDMAYTSGSFDGTGNVTGAGTLATVNSNVGTFTNATITVNDKGLITAASTGTGGSGFTWSAKTVDGTFTVGQGVLANKGTLLTYALPTTSAVGDQIAIAGMNAGLWKISQSASQQIHFGNQNTTAGVTGSLASILTYDSVYLVCSVANLEWVVINSIGNITVT